MPKRKNNKNSDSDEYILKKIKKLEKKIRRRRKSPSTSSPSPPPEETDTPVVIRCSPSPELDIQQEILLQDAQGSLKIIATSSPYCSPTINTFIDLRSILWDRLMVVPMSRINTEGLFDDINTPRIVTVGSFTALWYCLGLVLWDLSMAIIPKCNEMYTP